jgi:hypothetical protein
MPRHKHAIHVQCAICGWVYSTFGFTERVVLRESTCPNCHMKGYGNRSDWGCSWYSKKKECSHPSAGVRIERIETQTERGVWVDKIRQCMACGAESVSGMIERFEQAEQRYEAAMKKRV